ncbi:hypothetical protein [Nannocystis pusilla]|uniref:hypothetical protein n=1 Tax=Nannocystis pusilla TaxID=889268 RepID=UPI003B7A3047
MVEPQFEMLQAAMHTALSAGVDYIAAEAMAHMLFVRGRLPGGAARALEDLGHYSAFISRLSKPGHLQGLLLNNAAVVTFASGDVEAARKLYAEALAVKRASNDAPLEIAYSLMNLAILEDDGEARAHDMTEAVAIFDRELGPAHPQTIEARITASAYIRNPEAARRILRPGCDALVRFSPGDPAPRARCLAMLGYLGSEAGDSDESRQVLRQADALLASEQFDGDLIRGVDVALIRGSPRSRAASTRPPSTSCGGSWPPVRATRGGASARPPSSSWCSGCTCERSAIATAPPRRCGPRSTAWSPPGRPPATSSSISASLAPASCSPKCC